MNFNLAKEAVDLGGAFSPERIQYALEMTALGLLAVFAVLILIWGVLAVFKFFLYDAANKKKKAPKSKESPKAPEKASENPVVASKATAVSNNDATVAAIIAAISAYISEDASLNEQYANGFRVVSFKRVRGKASWNSKNN